MSATQSITGKLSKAYKFSRFRIVSLEFTCTILRIGSQMLEIAHDWLSYVVYRFVKHIRKHSL